MKKKIVAFVLVFAIALALGIGGTMAWLTAQSGEITNTFTVGKVGLELTEPAGEDLDEDYQYKMVPGNTYDKDPTLKVTEDSEDSWVFIKVTEANNTMTVDGQEQKIVNWEPRTGWTKLTGYENIWYVTVGSEANDFAQVNADFYFLNDSGDGNGEVTINTNLQMNTLAEGVKPTITFKAAAIQQDNIPDAATAWANLPTDFKTGAIQTPAS